MKILSFLKDGQRHAGVLAGDSIAPVTAINTKHGTGFPNDVLGLIEAGVRAMPVTDVATIPFSDVTPVLPYDHPPKIWCIGLNYLSHAEDINAVQPEEPGSFMKPASCMFQLGWL